MATNKKVSKRRKKVVLKIPENTADHSVALTESDEFEDNISKIHQLELTTKWRSVLRAEKLDELRSQAAMSIRHTKAITDTRAASLQLLQKSLDNAYSSWKQSEERQLVLFSDLYEKESQFVREVHDRTFADWDKCVSDLCAWCNVEYQKFAHQFAQLQQQAAVSTDLWNSKIYDIQRDNKESLEKLIESQKQEMSEVEHFFAVQTDDCEREINQMEYKYDKDKSVKMQQIRRLQLAKKQNSSVHSAADGELRTLKKELDLYQQSVHQKNENHLRELKQKVEHLEALQDQIQSKIQLTKKQWRNDIQMLCADFRDSTSRQKTEIEKLCVAGQTLSTFPGMDGRALVVLILLSHLISVGPSLQFVPLAQKRWHLARIIHQIKEAKQKLYSEKKRRNHRRRYFRKNMVARFSKDGK